MTIEYKSVMEVNSVVFLESTPRGQLRTGQRLYDDVIHDYREINFEVLHLDIAGASGLAGALEMLTGHALLPPHRKFVLQIDAHGSDRRQGLLLEPGRELVSWASLFQMLSPLNEASANNLILILACCFGAKAADHLDPSQCSPFSVMISPKSEIGTGEIERQLRAFHRKLSTAAELELACRQLDDRFEVVHAEQVMIDTLVCLWRFEMSRKRRSQSIEDLVTFGQETMPEVPIGMVREYARSRLRPSGEMLQFFYDRFLMASHPSKRGMRRISYEEFLSEVKRLKAE